MKTNIAIVYNHRHRLGKDCKAPVEVRVTISRVAYYIGTGVRVMPSEFVAGQIRGCIGAREMNERIANIFCKVLKIVTDTEAAGRLPDIADIRRQTEADAQPPSGSAFLEWFESQIGELNVGDGTRRHYRTVLSRLSAFGKLSSWADISTERIYEFDAWLHRIGTHCGRGEHRTDDKNIQDQSIYNYHKCLKAMLNRAYLIGKIPENPYAKLIGKFSRNDKQTCDYLTEDEIQAFMDLPVQPGTQMELAKDLFVFMMWTGLSFSDAQAFSIDDYKFDGRHWRHIGERIKTGVPFVSTLLPPAIEVLEKYGREVPRIDNQQFNRALKLLGPMAGIRVSLHSHMARHTFATMMLRNGAKIENVSKMLGHTNIKQTQRYAKVLAASVHEEFDKIEEKLLKRAVTGKAERTRGQ